MDLTSDERSDILRGDYSALKRSEKPCAAVGERLVVVWGKESRNALGCRRCAENASGWCEDHPEGDKDIGRVIVTPARELFWLEVSHPPFLSNGTWIVRFNVVDKRESPLFMQHTGPDSSSAARSIDKDDGNALEKVDEETVNRFARENNIKDILNNPEEMDAQRARHAIHLLHKAQREAAKLGLTISPHLIAALESVKDEILDEKRKAA